MECGRGPSGTISCNWSLSLKADGTFSWSYSDVGAEGTYACSGSSLTATRPGGSAISGTIDFASQQITWDGSVYAVKP